MPRFSIRDAVIAINMVLLTALFLHLKYEIFDKHASVAGERAGESHLPDELYDEAQSVAQTVTGKDGAKDKELKANSGVKARRTAVVVASQASENATWLDDFFPHWEKNIYRVDDASAPLTVPKNKGRESMVYLTYIIDNYDSLPDNVLFIHPTRYQWHNDDPDYDGVPMLRHLQLPYLESEGYVNIRCAWTLGCPQEIKPYEEEGEHRAAVHAGGVYKQAFEQLFPGVKVPRYVGVSCCAQFAATREKIREREIDEYKRWRDWVINTDLEDKISGRVLEYSWHMIFGKPPVHCPRAQDCYCKTFGLCDLKCDDERSCEGRYTLPPFSTLPPGWPYVGWEYEPRERAGPEE
ncbi:hypothetical protein NX059_001128 [Plenodomus lindquistii]|nr:hypothetical protein NX059_001128 [Plenodomus lindquistii]